MGRALFADRSSLFAATSMDLCDDPSLQIWLGARPRFASRFLPVHGKTVIGWGRKWSGQRAADMAHRNNLLLVEDGFLRSVHRDDPALSMVFDPVGVYYDARNPSILETLIQTSLTSAEKDRTDRLITMWRDAEVSKYNGAQDYAGDLPEDYVLVVDQVAGDASIEHGLAGPEAFEAMLQQALVDHPQRQIILKVHPDVQTLSRKGHFDLEKLRNIKNVQIISDNCHPVRLIQHATAIYTVTSQIGFEALIWGKQVHCFGCGFYAGYGLTHDHVATPARRKQVSLHNMVHAALIAYPRYISAETGEPSQVEETIEYIKYQRQQRPTTSGSIYAYGFSRWKRRFLHAFLQTSAIQVVKHTEDVPEKRNTGRLGI